MLMKFYFSAIEKTSGDPTDRFFSHYMPERSANRHSSWTKGGQELKYLGVTRYSTPPSPPPFQYFISLLHNNVQWNSCYNTLYKTQYYCYKMVRPSLNLLILKIKQPLCNAFLPHLHLTSYKVFCLFPNRTTEFYWQANHMPCSLVLVFICRNVNTLRVSTLYCFICQYYIYIECT